MMENGTILKNFNSILLTCVLLNVSISEEMKLGLSNFATAVVIFSSLDAVLGIRFVIDKEDFFSHNVQYEGDRVHASFVVIKVDTSWQHTHEGVDLSVSTVKYISDPFV